MGSGLSQLAWWWTIWRWRSQHELLMSSLFYFHFFWHSRQNMEGVRDKNRLRCRMTNTREGVCDQVYFSFYHFTTQPPPLPPTRSTPASYSTPTAPYPPLHNPFLTGTLITNLPNNRRANVRAILALAGMRAKRSWVKAHDVLTTWFFAKWNSHVELICLVSGQQYNQLRHFVKFWLYFLRVIVLRILE